MKNNLRVSNMVITSVSGKTHDLNRGKRTERFK